jgi:beta-lactamase regulating signal transducer with metallopeptidase domain
MQIQFINEWLANDFTRAFSWTLIHSLWQGLAAAIIAGLIIFCTKRSTAGLRYNLLSGVFLLFIAAAFFTFFTKYYSYNDAGVTAQASGQVKEVATVTSATSTQATQPFYKSFTDTFGFYFEQNAPLVVLVWFMVFIVQCLKLFSGFYYIQGLRRRGLSAPPEEWKEKLETLCSKLGIRQTVQFMQSQMVQMPVVLGYLKPIILVPIGMLNNLPAEQVETILLHELGHIRRRDYLINLLQSFAETVFFFNPAIKWISGIIREEREACCDDIVVDFTSNKTTYLQALVNFNDQTNTNNSYAMALGGRQTSLLNRVKRMLTYENNKLNIMEKVILVSGLVLFTAFSMVNTKEIKVMSAPAILAAKVEQPFTDKQAAKDAVTLSTEKEIAPAETPTDLQTAVAVSADTVPKTSGSYNHISTRIFTDGNAKNKESLEIIIQEDNGKKIKAKKVDGKITELYVDGKRIAESEMGSYKEVIQEIEDALQRSEEARIRGDEARQRGDEARRRGEEARQRGEEARKHGEEIRERAEDTRSKNKEISIRADETRKRNEDISVRSEEARKRGEDARMRGEEARARGEEARKRGEEARVRGEESRKQIEQIIDELKNEKVITDTDNLSFKLSNSTLIVNGVKQNDALHNKLKKFVDKEGGVLNYSKSENSIRSFINKN